MKNQIEMKSKMEQLISTTTLMNILGLSRKTILKYVKCGMPAYKYGTKNEPFRYKMSEVDKWLTENVRVK